MVVMGRQVSTLTSDPTLGKLHAIRKAILRGASLPSPIWRQRHRAIPVAARRRPRMRLSSAMVRPMRWSMSPPSSDLRSSPADNGVAGGCGRASPALRRDPATLPRLYRLVRRLRHGGEPRPGRLSGY